MEKHNFISMINTIEKYNTEIERWDNFGIVLYELPIYDITWKIIDMYLQEIFNEYGVDWIYWYLFDRVDIAGKVLPCFEK